MILNDVLEIASVTFKPQLNEEIEGLGSGQILRAELSSPLWTATIDTPITSFDVGRGLRAVLNDLNRPGQSFELYDPIAIFPRKDPAGTLLGAATPTISALDANSRNVTIIGLPNGYVLSPGDYFHVDYGGRRGFFEINTSATATTGTATVRVYPSPAAVPLTTAIVLIQPRMKCQFIPDSVDYGAADSSNWKMDGFTLTAIQKL